VVGCGQGCLSSLLISLFFVRVKVLAEYFLSLSLYFSHWVIYRSQFRWYMDCWHLVSGSLLRNLCFCHYPWSFLRSRHVQEFDVLYLELFVPHHTDTPFYMFPLALVRYKNLEKWHWPYLCEASQSSSFSSLLLTTPTPFHVFPSSSRPQSVWQYWIVTLKVTYCTGRASFELCDRHWWNFSIMNWALPGLCTCPTGRLSLAKLSALLINYTQRRH
jgi:hypothetical protein